MLKLLVLAIIYLYSCTETRQVTNATTASPVMEKTVLLEAANHQSAAEAQSIIHTFCPPEQIRISEQEYGKICLWFRFHISFPQRFNQMMDLLAQVPDLKILKQQ